MKYSLFILLIISVACNKTENENTFKHLSGQYLGQEAPADSALVFAPGIVSSGMSDRDITITPDGTEIYFCRNIGNFKYATIFYTKMVEGSWTKPEVVEFASNPNYIFIEPHISPDGKKFFFASNKQKEGDESGSMEIWVADREGESWGKPYNIGAPINTGSDQYYPSVTNNGTLYFTSEDSATNEEFIYRSKFVDGKYQIPELLPLNINMGKARFNTFISPDETFLIVPAYGMADTYGATDYYIVFRDENDQWSNPINMGSKINSDNGQEWSASISPDSKYLFFMSARIPKNINLPEKMSEKSFNLLHNTYQNGNSDIYWISTEVLKELK
jgi:hypothetical protein